MKSREDLIKELQMLEAKAKEIRERRRQVKESLAGVSTSATPLTKKQIREKYLEHTKKVRARRAELIAKRQKREAEESYQKAIKLQRLREKRTSNRKTKNQ